MTYRLKITKMEPNPDYADQVKAAENRRTWGIHGNLVGEGGYPSTEREVAALDTIITPAEWEIIKRALVQFWATTEAP